MRIAICSDLHLEFGHIDFDDPADIVVIPNKEVKPTEPAKSKEPEFKLNIHRENMSKGGWYIPNESKAYRPG